VVVVNSFRRFNFNLVLFSSIRGSWFYYSRGFYCQRDLGRFNDVLGDAKIMKVQVELDQWERRRELRSQFLEDESQISLGETVTRNNKEVFSRNIQLGNYAFTVFVEEYRGELFFVRASMALQQSRRKGRMPGRRYSRNTTWRERPVKPVAYASGEVDWVLNREGVFAGFPEKWDDYWANLFIKETLDLLRSPEIPKHFELHADNPEEI
jgi:hypothetical protein